MNNTKEVQTSIGVFELIKPKAGVRNRAVAAAEGENGSIKQTQLMMELMPKCINRRPEGIDQDVPIVQILDGLEIEDYDKLFLALAKLIQLDTTTPQKKTKLETS